MIPAASNGDPVQDLNRLEEIARLRLLEPETGDLLQRFVDRASEDLSMPTSMVSIVLDEAQTFVAARGLDPVMAEMRGSPVEWAFCAHSVRSGREFVVKDTETHEFGRQSPLPHLTGMRCYAGAPLKTARGHVLGNLCVTGPNEREFSQADIATLKGLADEAVAMLERRAKI
jgi:GAF domain-containing protein